MFWDDSQLPRIYTTKQEAVAEMVIMTQQDFTLSLSICAVIEDGYDVPQTIVYSGRRFDIVPLPDTDVEQGWR